MNKFQPKTHEEAYLAYLNGFITDVAQLPQPRTTVETLLYKLCVDVAGGAELPTIKDARYFFYYDKRMDQFDTLVSLFETLSDIECMFEGCTFSEFDLASLPLDEEGFYGTRAFQACKNLVTLKHSGRDKVKIRFPQYFVYDCSALTNIDFTIVVMPAETGTNTSLYFAFGNAKLLEEISLKFDESITEVSFERAFSGCKALKKCPVDFNELKNSFISTSYAFQNCSAMGGTIDMCSVPLKKEQHNSSFVGCVELEEILNIDLSKGATLGTNIFPYGTATAPVKLKRVTFTNGDSGKIMKPNLSYCAFEREAMVEFFNTMPVPYSTSYNTLTITGNPCVTNGTLTDEDRAIAVAKGFTLVE